MPSESLQCFSPVSRVFGVDRGTPIYHYYTKQFVSPYIPHIHGSVLQVGKETLLPHLGQPPVLLTEVERFLPETFDWIICSDFLQGVYDVFFAMRTLHRILKPQGTLLSTFPGILHQNHTDSRKDYWRFTRSSVRELLTQVFEPQHIEIGYVGNLLVALALLHGLAAEELQQEELDHLDPDYEVFITSKAVKAERNRTVRYEFSAY